MGVRLQTEQFGWKNIRIKEYNLYLFGIKCRLNNYGPPCMLKQPHVDRTGIFPWRGHVGVCVKCKIGTASSIFAV